MANGHGGYRRPANPAPVSGPGAHSRRTDGQPVRSLPDAAYGEDATFRAQQQAAPLPSVTSGAAPNVPLSAPVTPLGAPSAQPGTPVTDGAAYGAGAGPEALGLPGSVNDMSRQDATDLRRYLPVLVSIAQRPETPQGTRNFVRQLIASL